MVVKLLTKHHAEFLHLKGGCRGSSESTLVKMPNCWKSHPLAHMCLIGFRSGYSRMRMVKLLAYSRALLTVLTAWIFEIELSKITRKSSEYDQELPQSHTADQPMVP